MLQGLKSPREKQGMIAAEARCATQKHGTPTSIATKSLAAM
jgi:hypothetical protein